MSGDFNNYSSVQQPQISHLAKVQLHIAGEGGKYHFLGENQRKCDGADTHIRLFRCTLLEEG